MKLPNSMPSQCLRIIEIEWTLQLEISCFQVLLGERTNHYEYEQIYHPYFVWYVERSLSGDINPMSYHLTAFEVINH